MSYLYDILSVNVLFALRKIRMTCWVYVFFGWPLTWYCVCVTPIIFVIMSINSGVWNVNLSHCLYVNFPRFGPFVSTSRGREKPKTRNKNMSFGDLVCLFWKINQHKLEMWAIAAFKLVVSATVGVTTSTIWYLNLNISIWACANKNTIILGRSY